MTPFLSKQSISVQLIIMLVEVIALIVGIPGLPIGAVPYHLIQCSLF